MIANLNKTNKKLATEQMKTRLRIFGSMSQAYYVKSLVKLTATDKLK